MLAPLWISWTKNLIIDQCLILRDGGFLLRKWKQGLILLIVFFAAFPLITISHNSVVSGFAIFLLVFSAAYAVVLVSFFFVQQTQRGVRKRFGKLSVEEKLVKTRIMILYECSNCMRRYVDSDACPYCGSPYRRTVRETSQEETVEKWTK